MITRPKIIDLLPDNVICGLVAVADPGFPVGGDNLVGSVYYRGGYVSKILYVETKESGPLRGGGCAGHVPLDPPMCCLVFLKTVFEPIIVSFYYCLIMPKESTINLALGSLSCH